VAPAPRPPFSLQEQLVVFSAIIAIGAAGYAGYKIPRSGSVPDLGKNDTELTRIADQVDALELCLDVMEENVKAAKSTHAADDAKQEPAKTVVPPAAPALPFRVFSSLKLKRQYVPSAASQLSPDNNALRQEWEQALSSLRSGVAPPRQECAAAADRLGVVGELNTQGEGIARHQDSLEQLGEHFQRDSNQKIPVITPTACETVPGSVGCRFRTVPRTADFARSVPACPPP
jgi:outer membrane murein-binding lipoprotein Lpp